MREKTPESVGKGDPGRHGFAGIPVEGKNFNDVKWEDKMLGEESQRSLRRIFAIRTEVDPGREKRLKDSDIKPETLNQFGELRDTLEALRKKFEMTGPRFYQAVAIYCNVAVSNGLRPVQALMPYKPNTLPIPSVVNPPGRIRPGGQALGRTHNGGDDK